MANGNKLYSAYRGAGKSAAKYKASLYDVESLGIEREASQSMYQFREHQRDKTLALVQQGLGLISDYAGGKAAKAEAATDRTAIQEGMAKRAYEGDVKWDELSADVKALEMSKFAPKEVKRSLGDWLSGAERKYTFGEDTSEFKSSQITAASALYGENELSELLGITTSSTAIEKLREDFKASQTIDDSDAKDTGSPDLVEEDYSKEIFDLQPGSDFKPIPQIDPAVDPGANLGIDLGGSNVENVNLDGETQYRKMIKNVVSPNIDEETGLPSYMLKKGAKGLDYTTDGPETILVGDNPGGKEKVTVKPIKSKKKEKSEGQNNLADNVGSNLKDLVSRKGMRPGSKNWLNNYIRSQKVNNESLRPLSGELSKHNKKLFSMAEESGYFGEFFRGGWE